MFPVHGSLPSIVIVYESRISCSVCSSFLEVIAFILCSFKNSVCNEVVPYQSVGFKGINYSLEILIKYICQAFDVSKSLTFNMQQLNAKIIDRENVTFVPCMIFILIFILILERN